MLDERVLVLNQNYEPMTVCSAKRAIGLLCLDKAEVIEHNHQQVHSVSMTIPLPSVVRLMRFIKSPRMRILLNRRNIIRRDDHRCQYCGTAEAFLTIDHVIPKVRGGPDTWENLVCACEKCNTVKGNRTPSEAGMELLRKPKKPSYYFYIRHQIGLSDECWKPYLYMTR